MKKILVITIAITLLMSTFAVFKPSANALPTPPSISVQPSIANAGLGAPFSVSVTVSNLRASQKAIGVSVLKLLYNNSLLQVVSVTEGPFMKDARWNLHGTEFISIVEVDPAFGPVVTVGDLLLPDSSGAWAAFPDGGGTLATITFQAIQGPSDIAHSPLKTPLTLANTEIVDINLNEIPHGDISGLVQIYQQSIGVQPSIANAILGTPFSVSVTVNNLRASQSAIGIMFFLRYDDTLLQVVSVTEGPFMQDPRWNLHGTNFIYFIENNTQNPTFGPDIVVGDLLLPDSSGAWAAFPDGGGTLATITFKAISHPSAIAPEPLITPLTLANTEIVDINLNEIPHGDISGLVQIYLPPQPTISVQPSLTSVVIGTTFSVDVVVNNLDAAWRTIGIQFKLSYNDTLLKVVNVTEGSFMKRPGWNLHRTQFINFVEVQAAFGPVVTVGDLLLPDDTGVWTAFPTGTGTVATITFQAIQGPSDIAHSPLTTPLTLKDTQIVTDDLTDVPHTDNGGLVRIFARQPVITVQPQLVETTAVGTTFSVDVVVNNLDATWRTIGIQFKLSYNDTLLKVVNVTEGPFMQDARWNLHGTFFINFVEVDPAFGPVVTVGDALLPDDSGAWAAFPDGNGTLATITFQTIGQQRGLDNPPLTCPLALKDTGIVDDSLNDVPHIDNSGEFRIFPTNIGDMNFDGKVDMKDIGIVARAFGSIPGFSRWNPSYDVNGDGKIDMRDIAIVARNFGYHAA